MVINRWKEENIKFELLYQKQLIQNETYGYKPGKIICIFLLAPLILAGKAHCDMPLSMLKNENYKKMYKQRFLLLLTGTIFWITIILAVFNMFRF